MQKAYLHPAKMQFNAPAGCIVVSDSSDPADGVALISVDPHGLAMGDEEAEAWAAEICRRWNSFNSDPVK